MAKALRINGRVYDFGSSPLNRRVTEEEFNALLKAPYLIVDDNSLIQHEDSGEQSGTVRAFKEIATRELNIDSGDYGLSRLWVSGHYEDDGTWTRFYAAGLIEGEGGQGERAFALMFIIT